MEDATNVRKLVELIFSRELENDEERTAPVENDEERTAPVENDEERTAPDSSIPACLPISDLSDRLDEIFPLMLEHVLLTKQMIFFPEWDDYINTCYDIMFSSHRMYLKCVIFACLYEALYHKSGCEIFISVCALLKYFNERIFNSTGMDFRDLNTDVIVLLYDDILKNNFSEKVDFQKLLEYISCHRYLSLKFKDTLSTPAAVRDAILKKRKIKKELKRRDPRRTKEELEAIYRSTNILIRKVFERTSVELPTLLTDPDLIKGLKASGSEEKEEKNEKEGNLKATSEFIDLGATSQGCSSSNSDYN